VDIGHLLNIINTRLLKAAEIQLALIGQAYLETVKVLANTIEGRDPYTRGHVDRVSQYAYWLAKEIGWGPKRLRTLEFGARLHDIGKIIIPDGILKKNSPLTEEEWSIVKHHPVAGAKIVREISHLEATIPFILFHHERWNGSGYPYGLNREEIPVEGRLMAIVDVFDALTTERPYHPALTQTQVLRYLWLNAGKLFDPELVPSFIKALQSKQIEQPTIVKISEHQPVAQP
jgi:HD-GYP domain-containing protein (c-di-GMP phosphodiesterase class II)